MSYVERRTTRVSFQAESLKFFLFCIWFDIFSFDSFEQNQEGTISKKLLYAWN